MESIENGSRKKQGVKKALGGEDWVRVRGMLNFFHLSPDSDRRWGEWTADRVVFQWKKV